MEKSGPYERVRQWLRSHPKAVYQIPDENSPKIGKGSSTEYIRILRPYNMWVWNTVEALGGTRTTQSPQIPGGQTLDDVPGPEDKRPDRPPVHVEDVEIKINEGGTVRRGPKVVVRGLSSGAKVEAGAAVAEALQAVAPAVEEAFSGANYIRFAYKPDGSVYWFEQLTLVKDEHGREERRWVPIPAFPIAISLTGAPQGIYGREILLYWLGVDPDHPDTPVE